MSGRPRAEMADGDAAPARSGARSASISVDARGLGGWIEGAVPDGRITLLHGEREILAASGKLAASDGDIPRTRFLLDLSQLAAPTPALPLSAPFRLLVDDAEVWKSAPLRFEDLQLAAALNGLRSEESGAQPSAAPPLERPSLGRRLAEGVKRHGVRRILGFLIAVTATEGPAAAVKLALMTRSERAERAKERRRAQLGGVEVRLAPTQLELVTAPPAAVPFETAIFETWEGPRPSRTPLNRYQHYAIKRLRYPGALETDADRQAALIWYIETYSTFRHPFKVPFSGRQLAWLLEDVASSQAGSAPRIVEWFLQALPPQARSQRKPWSASRIAYWWSVQRAVELNVEHALIPPGFIALLSAPIGPDGDAAPACEFLRRRAALRDMPADAQATTAGRFAAYVQLLQEPEGLHFARFFPEGVLQRIADVAPLASGPPSAAADAVRARALEAIEHRRRCAEIASSGADLSAARLGQDWLSTQAQEPDPNPSDRRAKASGSSILPFPVRVIGPLNSRSGLGQAARLSIAALQAVGVDVQTVDFLLDNPAPRGNQIRNRYDLLPGPGANLLHLSGESLPLAAAFLHPQLFTDKLNVGYFFWELPHPAECHELALHELDELWVSSEFNREVYEPYLPGKVFRVGMALEPTPAIRRDRSTTRARFGLPASAFVFISTFDSFSFIRRKNPSATIHAFKRAFPAGSEDVRLVVKTHNLMRTLGERSAEALRREIVALCASDPRIVLINETLAHEDLLELKAACDAYVSLHRSEGWGLGLVEAMQLGLPVIATAYSGNLDFCTEETSWLVNYSRSGLKKDDYVFVRPEDYWAEPDIDDAARHMRRAAADSSASAIKGAAARRFVEANLSPEAVGATYLRRLTTLGAAAWPERFARPGNREVSGTLATRRRGRGSSGEG